jgi:uncharacterized protein
MGGRYLVLSDVHRREWVPAAARELIKEHSLDAVVLLGDITHFGPPQFAEELIRELGAKCYAVPGNCDPLGTNACIKSAGVSLHGVKMKVDGLTWGGLGGSNPSIFRTPFEMPEEEIARLLEPIMEKDMVLVLHNPAYGTFDTTFSGKHVGSTAVAEAVGRYKPTVVLSGHIHEDRGVENKEGVWYMNPGAAKDRYAGMMELGEKVELTLLDL